MDRSLRASPHYLPTRLTRPPYFVLIVVTSIFDACIVPPAVMLMLWRGAPPQTVAEVLHAVDHQA